MHALHKTLATMTLAAAVAAGCGGSADPAPAPAPKVVTPAPAAAPAPAAEAAETGEAAEAAAPAAEGADELHAKLINTAWKVGDFEVNFLDTEKVLVKGGPLSAIAPNGLEAKYSYAEGLIEVTAMGQTKKGTWDGETLTVDGNAGVRK